jgi:hypothetical protein
VYFSLYPTTADRAKKNYYAGVRKDGKLYEISGVPNPQTGGVLWYRCSLFHLPHFGLNEGGFFVV